ncbi:MAG TPA: ATP phosphoribosyltransferase regulatory subunit [Thermoleophilaceae bacterium]|nr:ATP phosphoribosyltransferase regulatory subunit [Thermoleophilaceae bacterium]
MSGAENAGVREGRPGPLGATPPGTRDVLPDEMRELRAISDSLRATFERADYGEVWTPLVEYEDVLVRGDQGAADGGYRLFDEHGRVLVLRSDMTIPIARVVASQLRDVRPPIRLSYHAHSYRAVERGRGQSREFLQVGIELVGASEPDGDAEVIALVLEALAEAGLRRHRVGVGDGSLYRTVLSDLEVSEREREPLMEALARRDMVRVEERVAQLGLSRSAHDLLTAIPALRGGPSVLERGDGPVARAAENLRTCHALLADRGAAERTIFDLGLVRELGYYTGIVFELYDPAVGFAIGGGGRYDELLGRFGRPLPACGAALDLERVHMAATAEERLDRGGGARGSR